MPKPPISAFLSAIGSIAFVSLLVQTPCHAQASASHHLTEFALNGGGDPAQAGIPASASHRITLDAIGDGLLGPGLSSASHRLDGGFVSFFPRRVRSSACCSRTTRRWPGSRRRASGATRSIADSSHRSLRGAPEPASPPASPAKRRPTPRCRRWAPASSTWSRPGTAWARKGPRDSDRPAASAPTRSLVRDALVGRADYHPSVARTAKADYRRSLKITTLPLPDSEAAARAALRVIDAEDAAGRALAGQRLLDLLSAQTGIPTPELLAMDSYCRLAGSYLKNNRFAFPSGPSFEINKSPAASKVMPSGCLNTAASNGK
jgi:hypothetical protein